jgi:plasmid stabilization system protein ParE
MSGRVVPEYDSPRIREVIESSYRIIYFVGDERIDVLAVVHTARRLQLED